MKKMISLLVLLTIYFPTYAGNGPLPPADHWVNVHVANDDCPEWTRVIAANGNNANRCRADGMDQADAVCVDNNNIIEWRGNKSFFITEKDPNNPIFEDCGATGENPNKYRCTVAATSGQHHYNIETDTCVLDPRILLN